jgi:transposase
MSLDGALKAWSHCVSERESAHRSDPLSPPVLIGRSLRLLEIWRWSPTVQRGRPLPRLLDDAENGLTAFARAVFAELSARLRTLNEQMTEYQQRIERLCPHHPMGQKLPRTEGVGPLGATALIAAGGDAHSLKSGRQGAAWLGFVPRQGSTGAKPRLPNRRTRGNRSIRTLLIHGARAVLRHATRQTDARSRWVIALMRRRGRNVAVVALAKRNARILWALMTREEDYRKAVCVRD